MDTVISVTSRSVQYEIGDQKARDEKLNISDLPHNIGFFVNDIGYITNAVADLENYYLKSQTYSKEQIDALIAPKLFIKIVDSLPTEEISTSTIYFLKRKKEQGTTQYDSDVYDEYIYVDGTWELIGNTYVDLTDYYKKAETDSEIDKKVAVETQNRTLADSTLQNNIDAVQTNLEKTNSALDSEIATRQKKDIEHETSINANSESITKETERAEIAENVLSSRCDSYDSHVADVDNPHNVTAEQVGLGNVTNVSTTDTITLDSEKNITSGAVYTALSNKVDKVSGKGLSDQNYTYAEKTKLAGLNNYDDTSLSDRISETESAIENINGDSSTSGSTDYKIAKALEGVTSITYEVVSSLPTSGIAGKIYFVKGTGTETEQVYNEYVWLNDKWEQLGKSTATIDLSDVYSKAQVNALVSAKNDKITVTVDESTVLSDANTFDTFVTSGANPTKVNQRPLSKLWEYIKSKMKSDGDAKSVNGFTFEVV